MIPARLNQIFEDMGLDASECPPSAVLGADGLGMDSQELIEFYGRLRMQLGVTVPPNAIRRTMTVDDVVRVLDELLVEAKG